MTDSTHFTAEAQKREKAKRKEWVKPEIEQHPVAETLAGGSNIQDGVTGKVS